MKTRFIWIFTFLSCLTSIACKNQKDGLWDDNIHLSQKSVSFDAQENSVVITTRSSAWWVDGIAFDNQQLPLEQSIRVAQDFVIKEPEFTVERREGNQIHLYLSKNETGKERVLRIGLQSGNYFDGVVVRQGF